MLGIEDLRGKHWGKRGWIIGSGKSLNDIDLKAIMAAGDVTFGFNSIFLKEETDGFVPTYHLVEDVLVAEDRAAKINAWKAPVTKIFAHDCAKWLNGEGTRYVTFRGRGTDYKSPGWPQFSMDAGKEVFWGGTVSYMAIQVAYYMGITTLCFVGMDQYKKPAANDRVEGNVITSAGDDVNHFDGRYFGKGLRWHTPEEARMQVAHRRAIEVFTAAARNILDCTTAEKRSLEGIYPFADWKEVLNG